ncbi:unnamed protein product [Cuscuta campestris]|uniref:Uncharacterized protein n=1 Tax=Cuscuta campestris TaxID=132261 RepID=A0A484NMM2_9ASTE|nr:unnamed protein product [Cuscuta campestris]
MGLRAPKEYACPLSTSPYYLPRKMREEVNLEEISMDFDDWVYNFPNKDLWSFAFMKDWKLGFSSCLGRAFSLSSYYKEGLPFLGMYIQKPLLVEDMAQSWEHLYGNVMV